MNISNPMSKFTSCDTTWNKRQSIKIGTFWKINYSSRMVLQHFEKFVIACVKNQIMGYTKIENAKDLYSFYENTGLCFTNLSSSRKSAKRQNTMFKSLFILNCEWEAQAFTNIIVICFGSLRQYPALAVPGRNCQQCLGRMSNIWNHLCTHHMQGWWWLLRQPVSHA